MAGYLFIVSRNPLRTPDGRRLMALATRTARLQGTVTVLLLAHGVCLAQGRLAERWLTPLRAAGAEVLVDVHALPGHGLAPDRLPAGVRAIGHLTMIDRLAAGAETFWS